MRTRKPSRIEAAQVAFFKVRRHPDHLMRWMAWLELRGAIEGWSDDAVFEAKRLLIEAETWKRGFRPPRTFAEASMRARRRQLAGHLGRDIGEGGV